MQELDKNKLTSEMLDYLYSDTKDICYSKYPSNLVEPLKVNEKFEFKTAYDPWRLKSMLWAEGH